MQKVENSQDLVAASTSHYSEAHRQKVENSHMIAEQGKVAG